VPTAVGRFDARAADPADPLGRQVGEVVATGGGVRLHEKIHDDLARYLRRTGASPAVDTTDRTPAEVARAVRALLAA